MSSRISKLIPHPSRKQIHYLISLPERSLRSTSALAGGVIREIVGELKENKLLDAETEFETVEQILDGMEKTSGRISDNLNCPPLEVAELRKEWNRLKREAGRIPLDKFPSLGSLTEAWQNLKAEATAQDCSVFEISSLLALSGVRHLPRGAIWLSQCATLAAKKTGTLFAGTLLEHYRSTLQEIHHAGYLVYWVREFSPYLEAAASNFSPRQASLTEIFLDWCISKMVD